MTALLIYGAITIVCGLVLFAMAVMGADQDFDIDADVDVDVDVDLDVGEFGGPSLLSLKLILIFLIGFGSCGFISAYLKKPDNHVIPAVIGGFLLWFVSYQALKWLYMQQATSHVKGASFVGREARVTVPIPKGGTGEVYATMEGKGKNMYFSARANDSTAQFQKGQIVVIKSVDGGTVSVE